MTAACCILYQCHDAQDQARHVLPELPTKPCMTHPLPASPSAPARVHAHSLLFQEAPKLQVDDNLPALVSAADGRCLPYVALEGKETLWPHTRDRAGLFSFSPDASPGP